MEKIIYNRILFGFITVMVLATLILSTFDYIDLGLLIIPIVTPYLYWLYKLMRTKK